jgi:hypothetical protein
VTTCFRTYRVEETGKDEEPKTLLKVKMGEKLDSLEVAGASVVLELEINGSESAAGRQHLKSFGPGQRPRFH